LAGAEGIWRRLSKWLQDRTSSFAAAVTDADLTMKWIDLFSSRM
jgi:hypothetical protein